MSCVNLRSANGSGGRGRSDRPWAWGLGLLAVGLMGCANAEVAAQGARTTAPQEQVQEQVQEQAQEQVQPSNDLAEGAVGLAQVLPVGATTLLGGETIQLEVTRSPAEQAMGLMYRRSLASDRGMLFRFEPARPVQFWMKNVPIELDMLFVYRGQIVGIAAQVPPCRQEPCATYSPGFDVAVDQVIELRGGRAAELGLAVGDAVVLTPVE